MVTKTKAKPAAKAGKKSGKQADPRDVGCHYLATRQIGLDWIDPSPWQPRLAIDGDALLPLASTMERTGFLGAVWVREKNGRFELIDGERRWRAAKLASLSELRAEIYSCSDAQAREMAMHSVMHREDLSPIERANAFQGMLAAGDYPDQQALAAAMGVNQSTVSNLVRLLKLPTDWQRRIISQEISERHARALLPFVKYPTLVAAFDEFFRLNLDQSENDRELPAVSEWEQETVPQIVRDATRSMDGMHGDRTYYHPRYGQVTIFEPDVMQEKQLQILTLGDEHLATNVDLWEELQKAYLEAEMERRRKAEVQRSEVGGQESDAGDDTDPHDEDGDEDRTAADGEAVCDTDEAIESADAYRSALCSKVLGIYQRHVKGEIRLNKPTIEFCQALAEQGVGFFATPKNMDMALDIVEEHWQAGEATDETRMKHGTDPCSIGVQSVAQSSDFYRWRLAWTRKLIAEALTRCEFGQLVKFLALGLGVWKIPAESVNQVFDEALRGNIDYSRRKSITSNLLACHDYQLEKVLAEVVASWFWTDKEGPGGDVPAEDCEEVAAFLDVDLKSEWQTGNILAPRALLDLYDDAGLRRLAKQWRVEIGADWNRKGIVAKLEQAIGDTDTSPLNMTMPAEVAKAKR